LDAVAAAGCPSIWLRLLCERSKHLAPHACSSA